MFDNENKTFKATFSLGYITESRQKTLKDENELKFVYNSNLSKQRINQSKNN